MWYFIYNPGQLSLHYQKKTMRNFHQIIEKIFRDCLVALTCYYLSFPARMCF